jgi:hypothetical protein
MNLQSFAHHPTAACLALVKIIRILTVVNFSKSMFSLLLGLLILFLFISAGVVIFDLAID